MAAAAGEALEVRQAAPELSAQQRMAIQSALAGCNLFITGCAGTGKSYLVKHIVQALQAQGKRVAITASTGLASVQVDGVTVHSFAGIGLGDEPKDALASSALQNKKTVQRWKETDVLLVDEVSMCDGMLLDKVDHVARACRSGSVGSEAMYRTAASPLAFGGVQLLLVGDFLQLPPVKRTCFAFESRSWKAGHFLPIELTQVFRQTDSTFVDLLAELRMGRVSDNSRRILDSLARPLGEINGIQPTILHPHRKSVAEENQRHFLQLDGSQEQCYTAIDSDPAYSRRLDNDLPADSELRLRIGTQVILLVNLRPELKLINGSRGIVIRFAAPRELNLDADEARAVEQYVSKQPADRRRGLLPVVRFVQGHELHMTPHMWSRKFDAGRRTLMRTQIPLLQAWAMTVHKCQGMTLDRVCMSLEACFDSGMGYVALSRGRELQGIQLLSWAEHRIRADPTVIQFYQSLPRLLAEAQCWWARHGHATLRRRNPRGELPALPLQLVPGPGSAERPAGPQADLHEAAHQGAAGPSASPAEEQEENELADMLASERWVELRGCMERMSSDCMMAAMELPSMVGQHEADFIAYHLLAAAAGAIPEGLGTRQDLKERLEAMLAPLRTSLLGEQPPPAAQQAPMHTTSQSAPLQSRQPGGAGQAPGDVGSDLEPTQRYGSPTLHPAPSQQQQPQASRLLSGASQGCAAQHAISANPGRAHSLAAQGDHEASGVHAATSGAAASDGRLHQAGSQGTSELSNLGRGLQEQHHPGARAQRQGSDDGMPAMHTAQLLPERSHAGRWQPLQASAQAFVHPSAQHAHPAHTQPGNGMGSPRTARLSGSKRSAGRLDEDSQTSPVSQQAVDPRSDDQQHQQWRTSGSMSTLLAVAPRSDDQQHQQWRTSARMSTLLDDAEDWSGQPGFWDALEQAARQSSQHADSNDAVAMHTAQPAMGRQNAGDGDETGAERTAEAWPQYSLAASQQAQGTAPCTSSQASPGAALGMLPGRPTSSSAWMLHAQATQHSNIWACRHCRAVNSGSSRSCYRCDL